MLFMPLIMRLVSLLLALAMTILPTRATPVGLNERDSIAPPITQPTAKTVWKAGETQTVTWDLSGLAGVQPSNPTAQILLGTLSSDGDIHLFVTTPIASGFPILGGNVSLVVPSVASGNNYIVCLFGSTRDISPAFTIVGTDSSSSAAASTHVNAASSSNTLPPHQTSDPSTSVSLPTGVTQTDPSSDTTTSSAPSTTATSPAGATTTTTSSVTTSVSSSVLSSSVSVSSSASESGGPTGVAGNSCSRSAATNMHLYSALVGGLALWVFL